MAKKAMKNEKTMEEEVVEIVIDNLNLDDEDHGVISTLVSGAIVYCKNKINREFDSLNKSEVDILKMASVFIASDWYYNRVGEGDSIGRENGSINILLESITQPSI